MENVLLSGVVGSTAYGLAHEESDIDRLGVYAVDTRALHGLEKPAEAHVTTDPDTTFHEARKYCSLALSCNPTAMELIWLESYETATALGRELVAIRDSFLSAHRVRNSYLGYASQQLAKIKTRGPDARIRSEKHARHLVRLLEQGTVLHRTGQLTIRLPDPEWVADMGVEIAEHPAQGDSLLRTCEEVFDRPGALPESPDRQPAEAWLQRVRAAHYTPQEALRG